MTLDSGFDGSAGQFEGVVTRYASLFVAERGIEEMVVDGLFVRVASEYDLQAYSEVEDEVGFARTNSQMMMGGVRLQARLG